MSIMVGTGHGARHGVLVKRADALETLEKANAIIVDKTGTLTEGKPMVQSVAGDGVYDETELVRLAASLENHSEHPLAAAIIADAHSKSIDLVHVENFESITGQGLSGTIDGRSVKIGNAKIAGDRRTGSPLPDSGLFETADRLRNDGQTVMFVTVDGHLAGIIGVADAVKGSASQVIEELHRQGIQIVMMTGDNRTTAQAVARRLAIDEVFAEVMPEEKAAKVKELQARGKVVAMAGDGVNDAPALAQADVGIAFASGTDVAVESADITLLKPDLNGILRARNLSRGTMKNIRQNLFFAFIYNVIGVPIAAGVLFPVFGLLLSPMIASAAMTFSSVSVILNALRLRKLKL
jgi:Cu+-exporting ATPase